MNRLCSFAAALLLALPVAAVAADAADSKAATATKSPDDARQALDPNLKPQQVESTGSVIIGGKKIDYRAVAGTLIIDDKKDEPTASMSYVAYFRRDAGGAKRPVTFLYNGGPGSATVWLHMGAFGPRRVVTGDGVRGPAAPYQVINNEYSLLDVSDLVFIDAPGTGFGKFTAMDPDKEKQRARQKEKEKDFLGVDEDVRAFGIFIEKFLAKYERWNSPKYIFGESYGTTRSAALAYSLSTKHRTDLNGVILLSQILNFDLSPDGPQINPGMDLPYALVLPTYTAGAWHHKKLPGAARELRPLLDEVEHFALTDYLLALAKGSRISAGDKHAMAEKLHQYTGLPVDYIEKSNLRVNGGQFARMLLDGEDQSVGRLDSRYAGPSLDPLNKEADYDPQAAAISSAYIAAYNDYVRTTLKFGVDEIYKASNYEAKWNSAHRPPGFGEALDGTPNVMTDLAAAMKMNPQLKVMLNSGYYDMATPYFAADYEMDHLPMPAALRKNIETHYYAAGHMMYVNANELKDLHERVARFISSTDNH